MNEKINYDGVKFGMLTVLRDGNGLYEGKKKVRSVVCKCDCGKEREIHLRQIQRGKQKSCGCLGIPKTEVNPGDKFNFWTVVNEVENYISPTGEKARHILVECVCGVRKSVNLQSLKKSQSKSCSCRGIIREEKIKKEKIKPTDTEEEQWKQSINYPQYYISTIGRLFHYNSQNLISAKHKHEGCKALINIKNEMYETFIGEWDKMLYTVIGDLNLSTLRLLESKSSRFKKLQGVYSGMKTRCNDSNNKSFITYGAKGIKVEEGFDTFIKFFDWSINNGYKAGLEIDRMDSKKGYSPENCRYITKEANTLHSLNLTVEDVRFMRSEDFNWDLHRSNYKCSDYTLKNILEYNTFKNLVFV